jgi:hypothetical protein
MPRLNLLTEEVNENNSPKFNYNYTYDLNDQISIFKFNFMLNIQFISD